jgi:hypothetical protein
MPAFVDLSDIVPRFNRDGASLNGVALGECLARLVVASDWVDDFVHL